MVRYQCQICKREFSTYGGLKQHANAKHHGKMRSSQLNESPVQQRSLLQPLREMIRSEHDAELWSTSIIMPNPTTSQEKLTSQDDDDEMKQFEPSSQDEDLVNIADELEDKPHYHLRKRLWSEERVEANFEESEAESELDASLDDAIDVVDGKSTPERVVKWPNDAYRDFLELIVEGNISNKIGDKIIKFFNKLSNLDKSPLPSSTKNGKDYLNQINSLLIDFKEKVVATYNEINFTLYYRPLFRAIQAFLQRSEVTNNFVHKKIQNKMKNDRGETRIFGEPFEGNWWLETEKNLPSLNRLLSIILYSDATTFDGLEKSSGHPVFLTLVQDTGIKTTESFRSLQRDVYHKCFKIMLQPLLEKSEALYFGINGQVITFAAQISFFLADMLEADDITATYKGARCKMPCHTCIVLQSDLNNMSLKLENVPHRTHENMKQVINDGQGKEYSVHSVENSFWKFPNLNIYEACVPDRMHHIDLGLFKYQLEFTQDILKAVGGTELQKKFDDQLRQISRFLGLKLLHKLGHLNVLTASDYRNIMKIAFFALDEIFEGNKIICKELCELYAKFSKMYIMSRKEMYTEEDLKIFEVKHKELTSSAKKVIHRKAKGFEKVLWELTLDNIGQKIKSLKKSENPPHSNFIEGLSQLISTLDTFLDTSSQESESDEFYIKIYDSVHLEDRHILRMTGEFQSKKWFGNIAVTPAEDQEQYNSDEGAWYGKVLLLFKFFRGSFKEPYELALVRWFDIITEEPELYGCPQLYYTKEYNTIPIGSINQEVHIVPRFGKVNRYLLNKYMF
ncbi:hypothetical protein GLOIN_2v1836976 [Rhizophagus irregularis DAOM 181602=DAOM 197198]|nr:hypothetical protein GLOIN_2v1836976 [Rhizophagus irregularis DAOM 181602=DAOM 197198]